MATPVKPPPLPTRRPPVPGRQPPPLPTRLPGSLGLQPPTSGPRSGIRDPFATKEQFADTSKIATRDVQRASGSNMAVWVSTNSTNVYRMRYDPSYDLDGKRLPEGAITIEFLNGSMYEYPNRQVSDWMDLLESSSRGRFAYYQIRGAGPSVKGKSIWTFREIRGATRSARQVAAMRAQREPVGARQQKRTFTVGGRRGAYGKGGLRIR